MEAEGVATAGISLVRAHSEQMQPPRALWVPFELGRPFGVPGDAQFQHRVLDAVLALFRVTSGPVLEDYAEDAPGHDEDAAGWVCPVSFVKPESGEDSGLLLRKEVNALIPWHALAHHNRGRTTVSAPPGQSADQLLDVLRDPGDESIGSREIHLAMENLKAFYTEAATARPGRVNSDELARWLWRETHLSAVIRKLEHQFRIGSNESRRLLALRSMIPRAWR